MATSTLSDSDDGEGLNQLPFTKEQIEQANMTEAVNLCFKHRLDFHNSISVDDIRRVLYEYLDKMKKGKQACTEDEETEVNIQTMISDITAKDFEMKNNLDEVYQYMIQLTNMSEFDHSLMDEFTIRYGDYKNLIKTNQDKLRKTDCPIVITGETSAGKSSLLNLIIGSDILPSTVLRCTSVICRLRNSENKLVVLYDQNDKQVNNITIKDAADLKQTLKKYTCYSKDDTASQLKYVDIYWPICMLHKHVIIVDTPGIGDTETMTTTVLKYLQEDAIAFIYVINSANAGGVQEDRILRIIRPQLTKERKNQMFDPRLAVFVCNKWDQIPKDEDEIVWNDTKTKLSQSWIQLQDDQVIKLSVNEEKERRDHGLSFSRNFRALENSIKTMVPACINENARRHANWMTDFLNLVDLSTATKINASRKTKEENTRNYQKLSARLELLTTQTDKIKQTLTQFLDLKRDKIAEDLFKHLNDMKCRKRLSTWTINECPSAETVDSINDAFADCVLIEEAAHKIKKRVRGDINNWLTSNEVFPNFSKDFSKEISKQCLLLQKEICSIHKEMRGLTTSEEILFHFDSFAIYKDKQETVDNTNEMILPLCTFGIGLLTLLPGLLFLPLLIVSLSCLAFTTISSLRHHFKKYKIKINPEMLEEWTIKILESLTETRLRENLEKLYFGHAKLRVTSLFEEEIPKILQTDKQIIEHLISDQKQAKTTLMNCQSLQKKAYECRGKVLLFDLLYLSDKFIQQNKIHKWKLIGKGACANVYKAEISQNGKWIPVALKRFKYPLHADTSYIQLMEFENLFNFDHPNVLKIYGASLLDDEDDKFLEIITELCERTLLDIIDTTSCGIHNQGTEKFARAFELFMDMNIQIAEGLEHIHSKKCVHRDLKLQNILIQDDKVKIADAGCLKHTKLVTGSVVGTPTYMAPEILSNTYSRKAVATDIYSFGIIMWEMWYQKRAFSESLYPEIGNLNDMQNVLERGDRPCLLDDLNDLPLLKQLLESCWNDDPLKRPEITYVKETLKSIRDQYVNKIV